MSGTGIVTFDYEFWVETYPEFASVTSEIATGYFTRSQMLLNNTPRSPVWDSAPRGQRNILLNMLVAHYAQLYASINGQVSPQTVGRISQAGEGSVSLTLDMGSPTNASVWFLQTKYGAEYWQATLAYRSGGRYRPGSQPNLGVTPFGRFGGRGPWG